MLCRSITMKTKFQCKRKGKEDKEGYCTMHYNSVYKIKKEVKKNKKCVEECIVCCDDVFELLDCGHAIHKLCVAKTGLAVCPLCRSDVDLKGYKRQFNTAVKQNKMHQYHIYFYPLVYESCKEIIMSQTSTSTRKKMEKIVERSALKQAGLSENTKIFKTV